MRRGAAVATGVGMLALAYVVTATTPGQPVLEAPFGSPATIGEPTHSRELVVTVRAVVLADEVVVGDWRGTTSGVWLAGELTVEATTESQPVDVEVFIDGVRYASSGRLDDGIESRSVDAGLPTTGAFAVELPSDILERAGARSTVIRIGAGTESRLDSVVELTIDLTSVDHLPRIDYDRVRDGAR